MNKIELLEIIKKGEDSRCHRDRCTSSIIR